MKTESSVDDRGLDRTLEFFIGRDARFVSCRLRRGSTVSALSPRAHNALLLSLARARLEDSGYGLPASEQGWRYRELLAVELAIEGHLLSVWMHRAQAQLTRAGATFALFERRTSVHQVRLGIENVVISDSANSRSDATEKCSIDDRETEMR